MEKLEQKIKKFQLDSEEDEEESEKDANIEMNLGIEEQIKQLDKEIQKLADKKMKFKLIVNDYNDQVEKLMEKKIHLIGKLYNDN